MMSAPSAANLCAWARPCPRAAPVISTTLPSIRPIPTPLSCHGNDDENQRSGAPSWNTRCGAPQWLRPQRHRCSALPRGAEEVVDAVPGDGARVGVGIGDGEFGDARDVLLLHAELGQ